MKPHCKVCGFYFPDPNNINEILSHMKTHEEFNEGLRQVYKEFDKILGVKND